MIENKRGGKMSEINWDEVLRNIAGKLEKAKENLNWNEVLEDIKEEISAKTEFRELVRHARLQQNLSLSELAEEIGVSEEILESYEEGEEIDHEVDIKITLWFFEKEEESICGEDLKEQFKLVILLCRLLLYGTEEQIERLVDFAASLCKNQEESSEE